jgi:hypothetical protein
VRRAVERGSVARSGATPRASVRGRRTAWVLPRSYEVYVISPVQCRGPPGAYRADRESAVMVVDAERLVALVFTQGADKAKVEGRRKPSFTLLLLAGSAGVSDIDTLTPYGGIR